MWNRSKPIENDTPVKEVLQEFADSLSVNYHYTTEIRTSSGQCAQLEKVLNSWKNEGFEDEYQERLSDWSHKHYSLYTTNPITFKLLSVSTETESEYPVNLYVNYYDPSVTLSIKNSEGLYKAISEHTESGRLMSMLMRQEEIYFTRQNKI